KLLDNLGMWMVNRRMEQRIREGTAPYQAAGVRQGVFLSRIEQIGAEAEAASASWAAALTGLITARRSARLHGFPDQELDIVKKAMLASAEQATQTESTQDAQAFIRTMSHALAVEERPRSAAQKLALLRQLLPGITSTEVSAAFAANFTPEHR